MEWAVSVSCEVTSGFVGDFLFGWGFSTVKVVRDPHHVCFLERLTQIDFLVCTSR
jgi:hypothetical protein